MDVKEQALKAEYQQLLARLKDPSIFSSKDYPALARRQGELESALKLFDEKKTLEIQLADAKKMFSISDSELAELAKTEADSLRQKLAANEQALNEALIPKDPNDVRNAIVEIRAAAGGDE